MLTIQSFVEFETAADLKQAVDKLDKVEFKGVNVRCVPDVSYQLRWLVQKLIMYRSKMSVHHETHTGRGLLLDAATDHQLMMTMAAVGHPGLIVHEVHTESVLLWVGVITMRIAVTVGALHPSRVVGWTIMDLRLGVRMRIPTMLDRLLHDTPMEILMSMVETMVDQDPHRRHQGEVTESTTGDHIGSVFP